MVRSIAVFFAISCLCKIIQPMSASMFVNRLNNMYDCGRENKNSRIVNGKIVPQNQYPWVVYLRIRFTGYRSRCGGSLITRRHVLTAEHCLTVRNSINTNDITVYYDNVNFKYGTAIKVIKYYRRSDYLLETNQNDIAILLLKKRIPARRNIRPVCLPGYLQDFSGKTAVVAGWGFQQEGKHMSDVLRSTEQVILPQNECAKRLRNHKYNATQMICAYKTGTDACGGDSGGPLMITENGRLTIVGVVSFGVGCAKVGYPGAYANVPYYINWIEYALTHPEKFEPVGSWSTKPK